jgi:uncharacterized membrane protein
MDKFKNAMTTIISRFRSPIVWASLGAFILWILKSSGYLITLGLDPDSFNTGWNLLTAFVIGIGIINNPENKDGI